MPVALLALLVMFGGWSRPVYRCCLRSAPSGSPPRLDPPQRPTSVSARRELDVRPMTIRRRPLVPGWSQAAGQAARPKPNERPKWIVLPRLIARVAKNAPQEQMNLMLRMWLRFPFTRPDYDWRARVEPRVLRWTSIAARCMTSLKSQGEEEFMRNSLCTLDFALAQVMTDGGSYQRPHTLSAGDRMCDMKWFATTPQAADGRRHAARAPATEKRSQVNPCAEA
ncbi:MAG TPA: hypothetical protein VFA45_13875 [Actinomycetes bacterium]|nr:hypothetical protein [Actinomycetes bacterium]